MSAERKGWKFFGGARPAFALPPGPGQESVWDYPRPPVIVADGRHVAVKYGDLVVARSHRALRVLETASPPTFYLPPADVAADLLLRDVGARSYCEWKGEAAYFSLRSDGELLEDVAWSYERPLRPFAAIAGYLAFYPGKLECYVEGERVRPQAGGFYGGWVTSEIVGPFKGEPGTGGW